MSGINFLTNILRPFGRNSLIRHPREREDDELEINTYISTQK